MHVITPGCGVRKTGTAALIAMLIGAGIGVSQRAGSGTERERVAVELVMPPTAHAIVREGIAGVAGRILDPAVTGVRLFRALSAERAIPLVSVQQRNAFVTTFGALWHDDAVAGALSVTVRRMSGDTATERFTWDLGAAPALREFWTTDAGGRLLAMVNNPLVATVSVALTGWRRAEAVIAGTGGDRWFNASLAVDPGENVVVIGASGADGVLRSIDTLHVYYTVDVFADAPGAGYAKYVFHGTETERRCGPCHPPKPFAARDACGPCHDGYRNERFTHTPVRRGQCMACHDSSSPRLAIRKALGSDADLCFTCHAREKEAWSADTMKRHAPVDAGSCVQCHSPHGTPNLFHLIEPINRLCHGCHDQHEEFLHPIVRHPHAGVPEGARPGRELSCAGCHDPHATRSEKMLRYGPGMQGCTPCHPK